MTEPSQNISPQFYARVAGIAYFIIILTGSFGEMFVRNAVMVSGDPSATANNLLASPLLWRIGIAGDLVMHACDLVVISALYILLKPVNKYLAMLALLFILIQTAVLVANKLNLLLPIFFLGDANYLKAFDASQLQTLAYLAIKAHSHGFGIGLIFFGFGCLIIGYLVIQSGFLPKVLGYLIQIAGLCYLVNSFALIIAPEYSNLAILMPAFIAELSFSLWLLFKGINIARWHEKSYKI